MTILEDTKKILPEKIINDLKSAFKEFKLTESQRKKATDLVIDIYKKSCFEPGEAVGIVSAQSISEPGTQMCTDFNERIIVKLDNDIKIVKIGEFIDKKIKRMGYEKINEYEVCDIPKNENIFVLGLDSNEKVKWEKVISCNRHESPKQLIRIKTRSGRQITATDFHSFVTRKNNKIISIGGKDLKIGDRIPTIRYLPENCNEFINFTNFLPLPFRENLIKKDGLVKSCHGITFLPKQIKLDALFGWFIGAYLSEGHCPSSEVCISNIDKNFIKNARNFVNNFNLRYREFFHHRGFAWGRDFKIRSTLLSQFMIQNCNTGSYNKRVPEFAYSAHEKFVSGLLKGYFDGDGNVSVNRKMIRVSSNSEELLDGIKLLLTRFEIFAHKCKDKKQFYLLIPYKYAPIFLEKIGSDIEEKRKRLKKLAKLAKNFCKRKSQDYTDMVSGFEDIFFRIAKKLKYPTRYVNNFTKRQKIGRTTLYRYIKLFERLAEKMNVNIEDELEVLKRMFNSDVIWDEIIDISYVRPSSQYVYDISVDGLETFTTFDGIITHNTMRTYHVAGAAEIKVTLGLPRLIEIFDARRVPTTPMMMIYLQKRYNTKEKAKEIAAEIQEIKLKGVATSPAVDLLNMQIEVPLDETLIKERKIKINKILETLKENLTGVIIRTKQDKIIVKPKEEVLVKELQKLKIKVLDTHIKGIKGISQVIADQKDSEWIITTLGSNLSKVLSIKGVDTTRTISNNIHEISKVLGLEAARSAIINEAMNTLEAGGLDVDVRHVMLVADVMTADGKIKAIGRYGVAGAKGSVLARANFEETIKHLTKAATTYEEDKLESVVENVMINQVVPVGTGMFDLVFKAKKK